MFKQWGIVQNGVGNQTFSFPISFNSIAYYINFIGMDYNTQSVTNSALINLDVNKAIIYANNTVNRPIYCFTFGV